MASGLSEEQKRKIEENRKRALAIRAAKCSNINGNNVQNALHFNNVNIAPVNPLCSTTTAPPPVQFVKNKNDTSTGFSNDGAVNGASNNGWKYNTNIFNNKPIKPVTTSGNKASCSGISGSRITAGVSSMEFYNKSKLITVFCCLSSCDRFTVNVNYSKELIDLFKTIPDKIYDPKSLKWSFPLSEYNNLKKAIQKMDNVTFGSIPDYVLKIFTKSNVPQPYKINDISTIDENLRDSLFPFQLEGVRFGITKNGRCIIADDMGLGKTIQALGIAHYYYSDWPLLIVCPSSMRFRWEQEIITYLPSVPLTRTYVMTTSKEQVDDPKIVITSYDLMSRCENTLKSFKFGVIIADESHSMKSMKTNRTKAALSLIKNAKRCILLSGTPALSRPMELYPQMKAIDPTFFSGKEFGIRYCNAKQTKFGWDYSGSSNMEELKLLLEERFMIRRLKSDVLDQLPSKMREVVVLESENIKMEKKVMSAFTDKLNAENIGGVEKRGTLLSYFCETGKAKIKAIQIYISQLLENGDKFLVFGHHREVLDAVCDILENKQTFYIRIDGKTNSEERKSVCDQFQLEDKFRVAVLSITAASTGITLTAASLVVFAELFWNPGVLTQAEDRVHRIGQTDSVLVQYLIAKGTADDYLWPLVQSKLVTLNKAGLSKDNFMCERTTVKNLCDKIQPTIFDYFKEISVLEDEDLNNLMDTIEGTEPKRAKLDK